MHDHLAMAVPCRRFGFAPTSGAGHLSFLCRATLPILPFAAGGNTNVARATPAVDAGVMLLKLVAPAGSTHDRLAGRGVAGATKAKYIQNIVDDFKGIAVASCAPNSCAQRARKVRLGDGSYKCLDQEVRGRGLA
jgi:hypothetical protein